MFRVAILIDGGFYRKRARFLFGEKTPQERADEMIEYAMRHLEKEDFLKNETIVLYRIFYYDCPPAIKTITHPLTNNLLCLETTDQYQWTNDFFSELRSKRKVAIRKGEILDSSIYYTIKPDIVKKLCSGTLKIEDLKENHFTINMQQKGVDMRIGLDIASLATKRLVDQIVLIAGDSDFVPAAKHARREGIDFILDPMWLQVKPSLIEHIDGVRTKTPKPGSDEIETLRKK